MILDKDTLTEKFYSNFQKLTDRYIKDNTEGVDSLTGKNGIYSMMCTRYDDSEFVSESTFKEWCYGKSIPKLQHLTMICDFFKCDLDYLFGMNDGVIDKDGNIVTSQIETYIKETYGLDKKTLDILSKYKASSIASYIDEPAGSSTDDMTFITTLNRILQKYPWLITNLGQIIYANSLGLSSQGLNANGADAKKYYYYEDLFEKFDDTVALTLLSIRLKRILSNADYTPNKDNIISTFDLSVNAPDVIDKYISDTMTTRLSRLEKNISTLSELLSEKYNGDDEEKLTEEEIEKLL